MIRFGVSRAFVCQSSLCLTPPLTSPFLVDAILSESFWKCLKLARQEQTYLSPSGDGSSCNVLELNGKVYEEHLLLKLLSPSFPLQLIFYIYQECKLDPLDDEKLAKHARTAEALISMSLVPQEKHHR
jgi:hypothetical protein